MNDKKILIALSPLDLGAGLVLFTDKYVSGENLDITIFVIRDEQNNSTWSDETVDALYLICATKLIPFRIKEIDASSRAEFADYTAFADLLIIEQNALNFLSDEQHPIESSCSIVVLPKTFESISNVLLISDGSREALRSIKQFFQIFSRQSRDMDVTLMAVADEQGVHMRAKDELLLINYIKQYARNIGVLKVRKPLTTKLLKPVQLDENTVVVSSLEFLIEEDTKASAFNPLQDQRSILFFPTVY